MVTPARAIAAGILGQEQTLLQRWLSLFRGPGDEVGVFREDTTDPKECQWLAQHLGEGRYWCVELRKETMSGSVGANLTQRLYLSQIRAPMLSLDDNHASIVLAGTWSTGLTGSGTYGGTYSRSSVATSTATFTTPAGTRMVGTRAYVAVNGGMVLVSIDGDNSRANLLPTAQDLVDAGALAASALVGGGGTLNPTDRILDQYAATTNTDKRTVFADDLPAGMHTVLMTNLAYKNVLSSETRFYLSGMLYQLPSTTLASPDIVFERLQPILSLSSVWEYATKPRPTGATTEIWVGNGHGYDYMDSITFELDGSPVTLQNGEILSGKRVVATRLSRLRHVDLEGVDIANVAMTWAMDGAHGLQVDWAITWLMGGEMDQAMAAMFPLDERYDRAKNLADGLEVALTLNDGVFRANQKSSAITVWDPLGLYGVLLYAPDVLTKVNNWDHSAARFLAVEDRSDGSMNKIYLCRVNYPPVEVFAENDVWVGGAVYRVQRFGSGAQMVLGKR